MKIRISLEDADLPSILLDIEGGFQAILELGPNSVYEFNCPCDVEDVRLYPIPRSYFGTNAGSPLGPGL